MDRIVIEKINREEALRYMMSSGKAPDDELITGLLDRCERELLKCIEPKYSYRISEIEHIDGDKIYFSDIAEPAESRDLAELLSGCSRAVLMCATIGSGADTLIRRMQINDMAAAVVTDAFASAAAEQVCLAFDEMLKKKYPDKFITWRFSPGYGDLPLSFQRTLLAAVNSARTAGITLDSSGLMNPIKSVSAVCGISDTELPARKKGCACCRMKNSCAYRRRGTRCEF